MKKSKIFAIGIIVLAIATLAYLGYPIVKERYFSKETKQDAQIQKELETANDLKPGDTLPSGDEVTDINGETTGEEEISDDELDPNEEDAFLDIFTSDCDNNCSEFTETEDIKYCKEYCGLTPAKTETNCDSLQDLEKDYCIKQEAVKKKDIAMCEKIEDSGIMKSCRNRVAEDIVDMKTPQ